uniref:Uncharacterized protein n=1 Tax=Mimivirus LCMiAC02 TaxID=2506609 RepID=A0A4P6VMK8_9VIRU|nr:MAG: hypothetical protein LCMiAC02_05150 [Mimivirus LCMiAC02]
MSENKWRSIGLKCNMFEMIDEEDFNNVKTFKTLGPDFRCLYFRSNKISTIKEAVNASIDFFDENFGKEKNLKIKQARVFNIKVTQMEYPYIDWNEENEFLKITFFFGKIETFKECIVTCKF